MRIWSYRVTVPPLLCNAGCRVAERLRPVPQCALRVSCGRSIGATKLQGYRATGLQGYRAAGLQGYRATELQGYRATELQGYRATGLQSYRATELRGF